MSSIEISRTTAVSLDSGSVDRYLDLLIECVNGSVYGKASALVPFVPASELNRWLMKRFLPSGAVLARPEDVPDEAFDRGYNWPRGRWNQGESMIGRTRLRHLRDCVRTVLREGVPGDLIETGVWRGGACILMKAALDAYGGGSRKVFLADSFQGLPETDSDDDAASLAYDPTLAVTLEDVREAFIRYGLLDERVEFVQGWFTDSLPGLADRTWSIARLDGDMYVSTRDALVNLYPNLSPGGFLIVDDYKRYESCRRAVHEYREEHSIQEPMAEVDDDCVYWRRGANQINLGT